MVAIAPAMIRTQTRIFGGDVFPTAWIHARRKLLSFWKQKSDAWDPAWFLPDYHTRKLRNEPFFWGKPRKTPNTK